MYLQWSDFNGFDMGHGTYSNQPRKGSLGIGTAQNQHFFMSYESANFENHKRW